MIVELFCSQTVVVDYCHKCSFTYFVSYMSLIRFYVIEQGTSSKFFPELAFLLMESLYLALHTLTSLS